MELIIEGQRVALAPLGTFRHRWGLPDHFGVAHFEPKSWEGLGTMAHAREPLARLHERVVAAVPAHVALPELLNEVGRLSAYFHQALLVANTQVGLRPAEIDYAVVGFENVLQSVASQLVRLSYTHRSDPSQVAAHFDYEALYQAWLEGSVRLSTARHEYEHEGQRFLVRMINNAYGRIGLAVEVAGECHYLLDSSLACPAANYMKSLCSAVAETLCQALTAPRA